MHVRAQYSRRELVMRKTSVMVASGCAVVIGLGLLALRSEGRANSDGDSEHENVQADSAVTNAQKMIAEGLQTFRFDTFGDEAFWGGTLKLHEAIEGAKFG